MSFVFGALSVCGQSVFGSLGTEMYRYSGTQNPIGYIYLSYTRWYVVDSVLLDGLYAYKIDIYQRHASFTPGMPPQPGSWSIQPQESFGGSRYLYHNEDRVYFHNGEGYKLYADFSVQPGDTLKPEYAFVGNNPIVNCNQAKLLITETGTMNINGFDLRYYDYINLEEESSWSYSGKFIERFLNLGYFWPYPSCVFDIPPYEFLRCYSDPEFGFFNNTEVACDFLVGMEELALTEFELRITNPAVSFLKLRIQGGNAPRGNANLVLIDTQGRQVKYWNVSGSQSFFELDISDIHGGIYMLRYESFGLVLTEKVVVE